MNNELSNTFIGHFKNSCFGSVTVNRNKITSERWENSRCILYLDEGFDGACSLCDKMIVWSNSCKNVWFLSNIDDSKKISCQEINNNYTRLIEKEDIVSFNIYYKLEKPDRFQNMFYVTMFTSKHYLTHSWNYILKEEEKGKI